jgi:hypothetical protein
MSEVLAMITPGSGSAWSLMIGINKLHEHREIMQGTPPRGWLSDAVERGMHWVGTLEKRHFIEMEAGRGEELQWIV